MDLQEYIKKVYTIAFRLTGDETAAEGVASLAINRNANSVKNMENTSLAVLYKMFVSIISLMEFAFLLIAREATPSAAVSSPVSLNAIVYTFFIYSCKSMASS
jgi:hypothetical protein